MRGNELVTPHPQPSDGHGGQLPDVGRGTAEDVEHVSFTPPIPLAKERSNAGNANARIDVDRVVARSAQYEGRNPRIDTADGDLVIPSTKPDIEIAAAGAAAAAAVRRVGKSAGDTEAGDRPGRQPALEPCCAATTTEVDAVRIAVAVCARLDRKASGDARQNARQDAERIKSLRVVAVATAGHKSLLCGIARDIEAIRARFALYDHSPRHRWNEKPIVGAASLEHRHAGPIDSARP